MYIYQSVSLLCGTQLLSHCCHHCLPLSAADPRLVECHCHADTWGGRHSSEPVTPSEGKPPLTPHRYVRSQPHWLTGSVCCCSPLYDYMGLLWMLSHSCHAIVTWPWMKGSPQLCRAERTDRHMGRCHNDNMRHTCVTWRITRKIMKQELHRLTRRQQKRDANTFSSNSEANSCLFTPACHGKKRDNFTDVKLSSSQQKGDLKLISLRQVFRPHRNLGR